MQNKNNILYPENLIQNPMISVIMSVYNASQYIHDAIDSILHQSYSNFEFIIVNDGSTDNSFEIIKNYLKNDNRIIVIDQQNRGLTASLNSAIELSRGTYIARMDADDISLEDRFLKQMIFLQENSEYALLGTNIMKIDSDGTLIEINKTNYSHTDIYKTFKHRNCIAHGSVMMSRKLLGDLLQYDETFPYAQDYRLWTQIAQKFKVANLKEPLYKLRIHNQSISKEKIEKQSIYGGMIAYAFDIGENISIQKLNNEVYCNQKLRTKIGKVLLMNFEPKIAKKYFKKYHMYYFFSIILEYIDLKSLKSFIKQFR